MPQSNEQELVECVPPPDPEIQLHYIPGDPRCNLTHKAIPDAAPLSILVVDDEDACQSFLERYFQIMGYSFKGASSATEALAIIHHHKVDIVVSDINMKGKDGIELMKEAKQFYPNLPFIIMTGYAPDYSYEDIINAGATDFLEKPFSLGELNAKISRVLKEEKIIGQLQQTLAMIKNLFGATVGALTATLEKRDPYTTGHQVRVSHLACAIAREMGLAAGRIEALRLAALVHDIGKIAIPADILARPGKLHDIEMNLIKSHSQIGYDILKPIDFPWPIAEMVLQHHERLDGSGYPRGLAEPKILLEAKIIGVSDVVEAMTSHRPYRPALELAKALEEISANKGILYAPEIVDACIRLFNEKKFNFR